jgi:hypothetical protein
MDTHDQLMGLRLRRPFVPFRIVLADGRTIELNRQLGFAVGGKLMLVAQEHGAALRVKYDEVVSIEVPERIS